METISQGPQVRSEARVAVYIDGFNLYFGLKSAKWRRFYWLDLAKLSDNLLRPGQALVAVKYFTARVRGNVDKEKRQGTFLEANQTLGRCEMFFGKYLRDTRTCPACGRAYTVPAEKMTDVNIAVELLTDAMKDLFDVALIVSGDSDLTPPVSKVRSLYPGKRVVIARPPMRHSVALEKASHAAFTIGRANLAASLLPAQVVKADGTVLICPPEWCR